MVHIQTLLQNNLLVRTLSASFFMVFSLWALFQDTLLVKQGVVVVISAFLSYEWALMSKAPYAKWATPALTLLVLILHLSPLPSPLALVCTIPFLMTYSRAHLLYVMGTAYVTLGCLSLLVLVHFSPTVLFWLLIIVWSSDIFAYFIGKSVGGPKLCPRISPSKTWSGFIGGTLMATFFAGILAWTLQLSSSPFFVSFALSLIGHVGDLVESSAKRYYGVKDSSKLLPGHGGFLDRLDSILLVSIVFVVFTIGLKKINFFLNIS